MAEVPSMNINLLLLRKMEPVFPGLYHVSGTEVRVHTISFNLLNNIYGVGIFVSIIWKRKVDFRDAKQPAQAIERHEQCENHKTPKLRFSPSKRTGFSTELLKLYYVL